YRLDIYRLGYYGGLGARFIATAQPSAALPQIQPTQCLTDSSTGLIDCGNWAESASWAVPSNATSGIYIAKLVREDGSSGESHIAFIVRDDIGGSDLLFQTSDTTWQAYNSYGGNSLYVGSPAGRAYKVSYNRPFNTRAGDTQHDWLFDAEYPMLRFLEANGYDVSYFTGVDTDRRGAEILEHNVFLSVGHDEYWSGPQRSNVETARDAGVHLAFFSGNIMFWKTRWENGIDASGAPYRTLVCYKETHNNEKIDTEPNVWTGTWRDPRFSPPADGGRPENALIGTIFTVNGNAYDEIRVPEALGKFRFWRNTTVATQSPGQIATVGPLTVGYEWDEDLDNGFRPSGLIRLSTNTVNVSGYLLDYGTNYGDGTATHSLTLYRHDSGALVFSAAATRWSWGLDNEHDQSDAPTIPSPDDNMRQATVNLFADMGVQPATLQSGLTATPQSTDVEPPASTITPPAAGGPIAVGTAISITGTASDAGGLVAGVNVSLDGGATWNRADGASAWSYYWTPTAPGPVTILSRAVDDSGNPQNPPTEITVTVTEQPPACPCSIWGSGAAPRHQLDDDDKAVEVGLKFRSDIAGFITGVRFYKGGAANGGTHEGHLWTSAGTLLGTATFIGESDSGWQQAIFPDPIPITANTTYVVSYFAPQGHYAADLNAFASSGVDNGPLHALSNALASGNGVYLYSETGRFPTEIFASANYWVDVVFITAPTP
ncbi:MAG TPA: N,N-dimethylformamidase beta subunit family domain-containing protein, partial [Blastocatellia bacterium]